MNRINQFNTPEEVTEVINSYIESFESSERRKKMKYGEDYYRSENTEIMNRKKLIYMENDEGEPIEMEDPYKANNKLPSGFFKILVDQKISYLLGNNLTLETEDDIEDDLPRDFQQKTKKAAKEASKKAIGWVQVYIDDDGNFSVKQIPAEQVIPVYKPHNNDELEMVIRYYQVTVLNEDNEAVKITRVEVWDEEEVTYYEESTEDSLYHLIGPERMKQIHGREFPNPKKHFYKDVRYGDRLAETEGQHWGRVPFVPLYNNDEEDYDLQPVKRFIDAYDIVNSDFVNNLEDFQDIYWVLKGYGGQNLNEFLQEVKRYKALKTSEDGEARAETIDIPHEARKEAKRGLRRDIFRFGMGADPDQVGDGSVTNVVIKSRYANLDLKADQFETQVKEFIYQIVELLNAYRETQGENPVELEGINLDRSMIMNEKEMLEANKGQHGHVSEETRLSNHPWIDNPEAEKEKMREEIENRPDLDAIESDAEPVENDED